MQSQTRTSSEHFAPADSDGTAYLAGVTVVEIGGQLVEYAGRVLADLGAHVIKVEPVAGEYTRWLGPFVDDTPDPHRSLHFWNYNLGKWSFVTEDHNPVSNATIGDLIRRADILLDGSPAGLTVPCSNEHLIHVRVTPFGEDGPWSGYAADDLVHLALGGMMMNCGYSPDEEGRYALPPIAPQAEQAYHIAGEAAVIGALSALNHRMHSGRGQRVSVCVHDAVSKNTEQDVPNWLHLKLQHFRQTGRHSTPTITPEVLSATADDRFVMPYQTYLKDNGGTYGNTLELLARHGKISDEEREGPLAIDGVVTPEQTRTVTRLVDELIRDRPFDADLWLDAQEYGLPWAPVRQPGENLRDEHWHRRSTFSSVDHPEIGTELFYATGRWVDSTGGSPSPTRAPNIGEHTQQVLEMLDTPARRTEPSFSRHQAPEDCPTEDSDALAGLKVLDLSWLLASGGTGRFFAGLGAEVIKVEHRSRWDRYRWGVGRVVENAAAQTDDPNRSGSFMDINAGKKSIGINLKSDEGRALLRELIAWCDVLIEGFSPGTMERMGLGYAVLSEINPGIIYVQQSGLGQQGTYGRLRSYGPTAQAISGLTEMSGFPDPCPPAGIGYSYLDWFGAYNMATAVNAALYRRHRTGRGCHLDASQVETGIYLTGTALLDAQVNDRPWRRTGNMAITAAACPSAAFPVRGEDRWITISCRTDQEWEALRIALDNPPTLADERFNTAAGRGAHRHDLERLIGEETTRHDGLALMISLQDSGVPAGICQTAQDRIENDPQLRHLQWLVDLPQTSMGKVPVKTLPFTLHRTPARIGGRLNRAGPSYGEDTRAVCQDVLHLAEREIDKLLENGTIDDGRQWLA